MQVVWDVATAQPCHILRDAHPHGVRAVAVTADGSMLATLSAADAAGSPQQVRQGSPSCQPTSGTPPCLAAPSRPCRSDVQRSCPVAADRGDAHTIIMLDPCRRLHCSCMPPMPPERIQRACSGIRASLRPATRAALAAAPPPQVALWDLRPPEADDPDAAEGPSPGCSLVAMTSVPCDSEQTSIAFSPNDPDMLITTGTKAVHIWTADYQQASQATSSDI
jgi:hypothetical protein